MKNFFSLILFLTCVIGFGQEPDSAIKEVDTKAIVAQPEPYEGFQKFYANLKNRIQAPENVVSGTYRVIISFIVDVDGTLTDFKIIKETPKSIGLGDEAIRVLKTFPKWKPVAKKTTYMLPVTTRVENDIILEPKKE